MKNAMQTCDKPRVFVQAVFYAYIMPYKNVCCEMLIVSGLLASRIGDQVHIHYCIFWYCKIARFCNLKRHELKSLFMKIFKFAIEILHW